MLGKISPADRAVFILGSGRCGSTVIQRLLNTHREFRIWGEHGGFLRHLADAYYFRDSPEAIDRMREWTGEVNPETRIKRLRDPKRWTGWDNAFTLSEWKNRFRDFIRASFTTGSADDTRWGFKEIRYGWSEDRSMEMLLELFPAAKFIIVVRHPADTVFSMAASWHRDLDRRASELDEKLMSLVSGWREQYESYLKLQKIAPESCFCCHYEDVGAPGFRRRLEGFLEVRDPFPELHLQHQDACERQDHFAKLIRDRMQIIRPSLEEIATPMQLKYGYPAGWTIQH
jgi:hypothetical protein